jgi:hypothetical protein
MLQNFFENLYFAGQEISPVSWYPKIHYSLHKSLTL